MPTTKNRSGNDKHVAAAKRKRVWNEWPRWNCRQICSSRCWAGLQRIDVLARIGLCIVAAVAMWLIVGGWEPPFAYRSGYVPQRDILARVEFREYDPVATKSAKDKAANQVRFVYQEDPSSLVQLRSALINKLAEVSNSATLAALPPGVWEAFSPPPMPNVEPLTKEQQEEQYQQFHTALGDQEKLAKVEKAVERAFAPLEQKGVLEKLQQAHDEGNQTEIYVHPVGSAMFPQVVQVSEVMLGEAAARLHDRLKEELNSPDVAQHIFYWLKPKLVSTLQLDAPATRTAQQEASDKVPPQYVVFAPGHALAKEPLVAAGKPLTRENLELLDLEHKAYVAQLTTSEKIARSLAVFGMFLALYTLSGLYIMYREPSIFRNLYRFSMLLGMFVLSVGLAAMAKSDAWRAESIPIMLFGMTLAIVYHQELALLLTAALALVVVVLELDGGMSSYITLMSAAATAILLLGRIRSRSKLIYVGLVAAVVAMLTEVGDSILDGQPLQQALFCRRAPGRPLGRGGRLPDDRPAAVRRKNVRRANGYQPVGSGRHFASAVARTGSPRPGTYNHSINVASIGEAAADAIGARGLLVRVGAYFHDIGKMLKPQYFTENQPQGASLHETLLPAMSRLIIVAHVKDGADLARQHHMPQPIIDFIEQHHGTTLVEYFYRRAAQQSDPTGTVEEHSYRYPGPKPLTKEAGVLMLADAAESASRALVEPTPSRLEGLVQEIAMNRLLDGQFDQCGLTLAGASCR